uniref:Transmembrane protein n=1 Tax=Caenorhabditis tropicalis TaxID=1561998 RepID=A0A1I7UT98_9PELO
MIPIQSIILFQLYIEIKEFKSGNLKKVAVVYGLIITVFALASSLVRVMVEHDDLRIKFHTLEFILPFLTLILLAIQLIQWMCMNVKINEKSLCVFVNSLFVTTISLLMHVVLIAKAIYTEKNGKVVNNEEITYNTYYLPFLWIISMHFSYSRFIRNYCRPSAQQSYIGKIDTVESVV